MDVAGAFGSGKVKVMATNSVYNMDCVAFMKTLPDSYFQWGIVDPPYGIGESSKNHKSRSMQPKIQKGGTLLRVKPPEYKKEDWDNNIPSEEYFQELKRVCQNVLIFGANYFPCIVGNQFKPLKRDMYEDFISANPTNWIVWDKVNGDNDFNDCEMTWCSTPISSEVFYYMWAGMLQGVSHTNGRTMQGNKRLNEKRIHPTQKPIALYRYLFEKLKPSSVFDSHLGSGSIRIVAHKMDVDFFGTEISVDMFEKQEKRYRQLTYEPLFQL